MNRFVKLVAVLSVGSILGALNNLPAHASRRSSGIETSLLGIHVLSTYHAVFARYGAPHLVLPRGTMLNLIPAFNNKGELTGGVLAVVGTETQGIIQNALGSVPGLQGMFNRGAAANTGGSPYGPPSSPYGPYGPPTGASNPYGAPGMEGPGGPSPYGGMPYGAPPGMPASMSSSPYGTAGYGVPALPGTGNNASQSGPTFATVDGYQWVYFYPQKEIVYDFLFNTDGRVLGILEVGRIGGHPTTHGLRLGDSLRKVYDLYGWPDSTEQQGQSVALIYNIKHHLQVNVFHNRVVAIYVMLLENSRLDLSQFLGGGNIGNNPMGSNRPGIAGAPGMPGYPGMPSGGYPGAPSGGLPGAPSARPPIMRPGLQGSGGGGAGGAGGAD